MNAQSMLDWLDEEIESWSPDKTSTTVAANTHYHMLILIREYISDHAGTDK